MGGYVALALHRLAPERIAGLLLADTTAAADTPDKSQEREIRARQVEREGIELLPDEMIPLLVASACAADVKLELRRLMLEQSPYGVAAALRALGSRPDATAQLPTMAVPTSVLCGEQDQLTPPAVMRELARAIPAASFVLVPDAGHMTNLEAPDHFNQALLTTLARVDSS